MPRAWNLDEIGREEPERARRLRMLRSWVMGELDEGETEEEILVTTKGASGGSGRRARDAHGRVISKPFDPAGHGSDEGSQRDARGFQKNKKHQPRGGVAGAGMGNGAFKGAR